MSQRFKVANGDWSISIVISVTAAALASSMIQAMDSTKHYAKWCWSPQKPQTISNDQCVTPLTPNMKTGGMWFTFPQLAGGANVTFLNPSLALSIEVERDSPSQWKNNCKTKNWMAQRKWQNGSYCYNNTYRREYFFFQKWGGRQTYWMLSRQRRENSVHSTFSTNKEWKRRGGLCQPVLDVNYDHYICHFIKFLAASWLSDVMQDFCFHMREWHCVGSAQSH